MRILPITRKRRAAISLLETMIATGIGSMLLGTIMALSSYTARSFGAISNYVALDRASRKALDQLTLMVRESDGVTDYATNRLELSYHGAPLIYTFNAGARTLQENWNGQTRTMLEGCDSFTFGVFQRNSIGGTYDQYPATLDESAAKIVQVSWVCSRQLLGSLINTESIQSAKIVIRKQ